MLSCSYLTHRRSSSTSLSDSIRTLYERDSRELVHGHVPDTRSASSSRHFSNSSLRHESAPKLARELWLKVDTSISCTSTVGTCFFPGDKAFPTYHTRVQNCRHRLLPFDVRCCHLEVRILQYEPTLWDVPLTSPRKRHELNRIYPGYEERCPDGSQFASVVFAHYN